MKTVDISIIVCTYNRAKLLRGALQSLICQETSGNLSYEILVIDDGSTDGTISVVMEVGKSSKMPIRYVREEGKGVASARNRGVNESRGSWITFCDDDQLAERDWLNNLLDVALQVGCKCVAGTIKLSLEPEQISHLGPECRSSLGEYIWHEKPTIHRGRTLPATGNLLISRNVFDSIGFFDTSLSSGEDSDLLSRARAAGFDIWTAPSAVIYHFIPPYRLQPAYFRWDSLKSGSNLAHINCKKVGRGKTLLLCIARIGQALLVNLPYLIWAYLMRDKVRILDLECLLWRVVGYTRRTVYFLSPRVFPQTRYFARLVFRKREEVVMRDLRRDL